MHWIGGFKYLYINIKNRHCMNSLKQMAESILGAITNGESIDSILLKVKIFAAQKGDKDLSQWVNQEMNGYDGDLPEYRKLVAGVKVDISRGFQIVTDFTYPIDAVKEKEIRERLRIFPINKPIVEIEEFSKSDSSIIQMDVPVGIWSRMQHCIDGSIQRVYQFTTVSGIKNIIVKVKDKSVDCMLKYGENEDIDFESIMNPRKKEIYVNQTTYNAGIINTGAGNITANNTTNIVGNNNTVSPLVRDELLHILDDIKNALPGNNKEFDEVVSEIDEELNQPNPTRRILKRSFQALGGILQNVCSGIIVEGLFPLIANALNLLQ